LKRPADTQNLLKTGCQVTFNRDEDNVRIYHLCKADIERIEQLGVGRPVQLMREFRIEN